MEQTVQEVVQQASGVGPWNWLQVIAALGTVVSVTTLGLTIFFRIRDSKTQLKITFRISSMPRDKPQLFFRVINKSKKTVLIGRSSFEYEDGKHLGLAPLSTPNKTLL